MIILNLISEQVEDFKFYAPHQTVVSMSALIDSEKRPQMEEIPRPTNQNDVDVCATNPSNTEILETNVDDIDFSARNQEDNNSLATNQNDNDCLTTNQDDNNYFPINQDDIEKCDANDADPTYSHKRSSMPLPEDFHSHNISTDKKLATMVAEKIPQPFTKCKAIVDTVKKMKTIDENSLKSISPAASPHPKVDV